MVIFWKGFRCLLGAMVMLCLTTTVVSFASAPSKIVAQYKVSSMGFTIGDVTTTQRMTVVGGLPTLSFETRTAVNASFLWMGYHLNTSEKGTLQKQDLISYSRKGEENGKKIDIEGRLEHSCFRFDVRGEGTMRSIVIPRSSYDYTTMECPEALLDFSKSTSVTLRILDVEKMAVVNRNYRLVRTAHYKITDKEYPCRIVDYSDQNKQARRWLTWDGSTVVMYRQDAKGEKNSYSVQATSVSKEM